MKWKDFQLILTEFWMIDKFSDKINFAFFQKAQDNIIRVHN